MDRTVKQVKCCSVTDYMTRNISSSPSYHPVSYACFGPKGGWEREFPHRLLGVSAAYAPGTGFDHGLAALPKQHRFMV